MKGNWRAFRPHGDAISPYIFVLCMERLGHIIHEAVNAGQRKPIQLSRNGPYISHLFFADDLILLAEASLDQTNTILECLDLFCIRAKNKSSEVQHLLFMRCKPGGGKEYCGIGKDSHLPKVGEISRNPLPGVLPPQVRMQLMNKLLRQDNDREDSFCWGLTSDGSFTVKKHTT